MRKKLIVILSLIIIAISSFGYYYFYSYKEQADCINTSDMQQYYENSTSKKCSQFITKRIDNYYYCLALRNDNIADLIIFNSIDEDSVTYFGGCFSNANEQANTNYDYYACSMPDNKDEMVEMKYVYFSYNTSGIEKAAIEIKEDGYKKTEEFSLDPQSPFIFVIKGVGENKQVIGETFYGKNGKVIPQPIR